MRGIALALLTLLAAASARAATLTVALDDRDPATLDPHKQFAYRNHILCQQIFDGLVRFDPDGKIVPALARSWERIDPLRMRFRLREGVSFHDGEPFNAESVRYSVERYLDPKTGFPARGFLDSIDRVELRTEHELDIVTKYPDGLLLNRLAGFVLIVPPRRLAAAGSEAFARRPIGTGAFRFAGWEAGKAVRLEANRSYFVAGQPRTDALVFRFISAEERVESLLAGEVDLIWEIPGSRTLEVQKHPSAKIVKGETFFTVFAGLNFSTGPLTDLRVRRALNYAVDRRALIRYDLLGNGKVLASSSMPKEGGHEPELAPYPYDLGLARRLLKEAGYSGGLTLRAIVNVNAQRTAKILSAQLERVGVRLEQEMVTESEFGRFGERRHDLSIGGSPDPMAHSYFIQSIILYSRSPFSLAADPRYDALLEEMVSSVDEGEREKLGRALDRFVHERFYGIPTYQRLQTYGARKDLIFDHYVTGMPYFAAAHFKGGGDAR